MESLRATGYSLPDAVSDLIDNSIAAGARDIRLHFQWAGRTLVSILDDGCGMSEPALIDAMLCAAPRVCRRAASAVSWIIS